jgi:hypothetical protein
MKRRLTLLLVGLLLAMIAFQPQTPTHAESLHNLPPDPSSPQAINLPADLGWNVRDYGARGDGVTDDTAAIQALLRELRPRWADYGGFPRAVYFPPGTYLVSGTLGWPGCCLMFQGAGSGQTIIRLKDNAAGFTNPATPKAVIQTEQGNMSHAQYIKDLTIDTGRGNAGAIALDYIASNTGAVRNVIIRSGDGRGLTGIAMTRQWPGPQLLRDIHISGFQVGMDIAHAEYGIVMENIRLSQMTVAGIRNHTNALSIRYLFTDMSAPALISRADSSSVVLLDSDLRNGAAGSSAVQVEGELYARNVTTSGYGSVISTDGVTVPGTTVSEYLRNGPYTLDPSSSRRPLNLPIQPIPTFHNNDLATWGRFNPGGYDSGSSNRALTSLFSNPALTTIYFRSGASIWGQSRFVVPAHVRRIVSFMHQANNWDGVGLVLEVNQNGGEPLIIEGLGAQVIHSGSRPVVLKDGGYRYTALPGAGDVYFDNVVMEKLVFQAGQRVWGWQFNTEHSGDPAMIVNQGAQVWLFGVKTEGSATVAEARGGQTEIYGTLVYPACAAMPTNRAAFINVEAALSVIMSFSNYANCTFYPVVVRETRGGVTRELRPNAFPWRTLSLYVGGPAAPPALLGDINGDGAVTLADFALLAAAFNKREGEAGYEARADLNADWAVTLADFSILASNFNRTQP